MNRHRVALLALAALAGGIVSCNDPVVPDRSGVYSVADTIIFGTDTTVYLFHWPAGSLPVRFWADPRSNMDELVTRAVREWEAQFLYGEFRGILVADSGEADVIARWTDSVPADVPPDEGTPISACGGVTTFDYDTTLVGPVRVSLTVLAQGAPATPAQLQACMRRIAVHEIGHALGIGFPSGRHSPYSEDVMFGAPVVDSPSRFDRRSAELLYHLTPTVGPIRR